MLKWLKEDSTILPKKKMQICPLKQCYLINIYAISIYVICHAEPVSLSNSFIENISKTLFLQMIIALCKIFIFFPIISLCLFLDTPMEFPTTLWWSCSRTKSVFTLYHHITQHFFYPHPWTIGRGFERAISQIKYEKQYFWLKNKFRNIYEKHYISTFLYIYPKM